MTDETLLDIEDHITRALAKHILDTEVQKGELVVKIKPESVKAFFSFLRDDTECAFRFLMDITAVDFPERTQRFEVVYNLLSIKQNLRVRIKICVQDGQVLPTVTNLYNAAGWFEREVWDMFGIRFNDHPDLRRILTDYGFEGHPLRKDFPLTGHYEVRYDDTEQRVVYEPVKLDQDFRRFDYVSPWEGMTDVQSEGEDKNMKPEYGYREE